MSKLFTNFSEFSEFLEELEENSSWLNVPPTAITVSPKPCESIDDILNREYIVDIDGVEYPVLQGYENTVFARAQVYGEALKLLPGEVVAEFVNKAFGVRPRNELYKTLIRFGKCYAMHSQKYSPISQLSIFERANGYFDDLFAGAFVDAIYDEDLTSTYFKLCSKELSRIYTAAFTKAGKPMEFVSFSARVTTSDVAVSGANISLFAAHSNGATIPFGDIRTKHMGENSIVSFGEKLNEVFPLLKKKAQNMAELAELELAHPQNVLIQLLKKLKISRKIATVIYDRYCAFEPESDTALNILLEISSVLNEMKINKASATQIVDVEGRIARLSKLDFTEADCPGVFTWSA